MSEITLPLLYKQGKRGEIRYWECSISGDTFKTRAGVLKNRERHQWESHQRSHQYEPSHGSYKSGDQVAYDHAMSKWTEKKRNDAMTESLEEIENPHSCKYQVPIAPVLATRYDKLKERHDIYQKYLYQGMKPSAVMYTFPDRDYYWEYKFDGERGTVSLHDGDVHIYSRGRVEIPHLEKQKEVFKKIYTSFGRSNPFIYDWHFDCEIMLPEKCRNSMRSAVSRLKDKHPENNKIVLYVFDIITVYGMAYRERREILEKIMSKVKSQYVILVPTLGKAKLGDPIIDEYCAQAVSLGFEGIMGKDESFIYPLYKQRLDELVKYKVENDDEYEIISAHEGKDAHEGMIIFDVRDINDGLITFSVTPAWSHDDRREAWVMYTEDPMQFIGKLITIVYKYKSIYGRPEEARATRIRDKADMSVASND